MRLLDTAAVHRLLDYDGCISAVRTAMEALSRDDRDQPLRSIVKLEAGRMFGLMPGMMPGDDSFGAKLVSVFPDQARAGRSAHRGVVVLFDGASGEVCCIADAGAVTHIRTGCASAVATDVLARTDARRLGIFGCGAQAESHIAALPRVREFEAIGIWGREAGSAERLAAATQALTGIETQVFDEGEELADASDVICTVTAAADPVLLGRWVRPGTHVNVVGSSYAGPREVDTHLVAVSRYFADYRRSALVAAAEFVAAKAEGAIDDDHIRGEIGEVIAGLVPGRRSSEDITVYKSLGHIAQDLAAVSYALERSEEQGQ